MLNNIIRDVESSEDDFYDDQVQVEEGVVDWNLEQDEVLPEEPINIHVNEALEPVSHVEEAAIFVFEDNADVEGGEILYFPAFDIGPIGEEVFVGLESPPYIGPIININGQPYLLTNYELGDGLEEPINLNPTAAAIRYITDAEQLLFFDDSLDMLATVASMMPRMNTSPTQATSELESIIPPVVNDSRR